MSARAAEARRRRADASTHLWVVRRRSRNLIRRGEARRVAPAIIVSTILAVTVVFGVLLEHVVLAQSAFKLADLRRQVLEAESRREELRLQAARLASPGRVERYAKTRLGMVTPASVEYMVADIPARRNGLVARLPDPRDARTGHAVGSFGADGSP